MKTWLLLAACCCLLLAGNQLRAATIADGSSCSATFTDGSSCSATFTDGSCCSTTFTDASCCSTKKTCGATCVTSFFRSSGANCFSLKGLPGGHHKHGGHKRRSLADKHAPAGLMGDHLHDPGKIMVEYKYMNMYMEDNRIGSTRVPDSAVLPPVIGAFSVDGIVTNNGATPTQMTMEMHMVHLMLGLTENVTAYTMIMLPSLTMDHLREPANPAPFGSSFTTHNSGFGDTGIGALIGLYESEDTDVILNLGGTIPTGDIFRTTTIPTGGAIAQPLPFPMRLGSGTFNARPAITWKRYFKRSSSGIQLWTDIPIGRNYRGYSVSDVYSLNGWSSYLLNDNLALSARIENQWRSNFDGIDPQTPDGVISTNVERFRGGYTLNFGLGLAALRNGHLFNIEAVPTLYQDLDGVQLETDWSIVASWSKSY